MGLFGGFKKKEVVQTEQFKEVISIKVDTIRLLCDQTQSDANMIVEFAEEEESLSPYAERAVNLMNEVVEIFRKTSSAMKENDISKTAALVGAYEAQMTELNKEMHNLSMEALEKHRQIMKGLIDKKQRD